MSPVPQFLANKAINTRIEVRAYEYLWQQPSTTTQTLAELFEQNPGSLPSDLVDSEVAESTAGEVVWQRHKRGIKRCGVRINGGRDYPSRLRDAKDPIESHTTALQCQHAICVRNRVAQQASLTNSTTPNRIPAMVMSHRGRPHWPSSPSRRIFDSWSIA